MASRSSISFESSATLKSEDGVNWETEEQTKEQEARSKRQNLVQTSVGKTLFEQLQERKDAAQAAFEAQKRMHFGSRLPHACSNPQLIVTIGAYPFHIAYLAPSQKLDEDEVAFLNEKADEQRMRDKKLRDQELEDRMRFRSSPSPSLPVCVGPRIM